MRRRRYYRGYGDLPVGMDAFLPSLVGGGGAMGTTLILRGLVPQYKKDEAGNIKTDEEGKPVENFAFKYAGLIGGGVGALGSVVLGPFKGWGYAISGGLTAMFTGLTSTLYNAVVPKEEEAGAGASGYRYMVSRRSPYGQPVLYRGGSRLGYMVGTPVDKKLPENVTAFPSTSFTEVNMRAFGGK